MLLGLALAARHQRPQDPGQIDALHRVEGRIADELKRLDKMQRSADRILDEANAISGEVRKAKAKLGTLLQDAKKTLTALNVQLEDANAMHDEPIELPLLDADAAE